MKTDAYLSPREREVAFHLSQGLSIKQTAEAMHVIYQCVANHVQNIYNKIGGNRNVNAIVSWWFRVNFDITFDLSPIKRKGGAIVLLMIFSISLLDINHPIARRARRGRRSETEYLIEL